MLTKRKVFHVFERYPLEIAILGLLGLLYFPLIMHWVDGWLNKSISIQHEYFSHGLIGLPFAAYISWTHRQKWRRLPDACHPLGIICLPIAAVFYLSGLPDWMNLSLPLNVDRTMLEFERSSWLETPGISPTAGFFGDANPSALFSLNPIFCLCSSSSPLSQDLPYCRSGLTFRSIKSIC